jgi:hypothetical protein
MADMTNPLEGDEPLERDRPGMARMKYVQFNNNRRWNCESAS